MSESTVYTHGNLSSLVWTKHEDAEGGGGVDSKLGLQQLVEVGL